jgi:GAF domain-containing protein
VLDGPVDEPLTQSARRPAPDWCHTVTMSHADRSIAEELAELALTLRDEPTLEETVGRVLEYTLKALDCAYAGVILVRKGGAVETFAATHELVAHLDQVQFEQGEGPDIDIITDRHGVLVPDVRAETRWPAWARQVGEAGIRSMVGTRLHTSSHVIGSLNAYDPAPGHFDVDDQAVAHLLARHAAVAMDTATDAANLWKAIDARALVGQAQGILMERFRVDADQAFAILRRYSQDHNVKLHTVARRLIDEGTLPPAS